MYSGSVHSRLTLPTIGLFLITSLHTFFALFVLAKGYNYHIFQIDDPENNKKPFYDVRKRVPLADMEVPTKQAA